MIQKKKLGEIANISAGQGAPQGAENYSEEGTPFVKAGDLYDLVNGKCECDIQKVSDEVAKNHRLKLYPKGTVLFAKSGMSCMKGYVYATNSECYVVSHLACIMPFDVDSKYLKYYFEYHKPNLLVKDASYPSISLADIAEMPINVFDDQTQAKIVDNLDAVNSLIVKRKEELVLLDNIVKSRFIELFGDPASNSPKWDTGRLGDYMTTLTDFSANGSYALLDSQVVMYDEPHYAIMVRTTDLETGDLKNGVKYIDQKAYELLGKSKLFGGEMIMNKIGSAGKIYLMPHIETPASLGRNAFMFRFDQRVNIVFLYALLTSEYGTAEIQQHVRGAVTKTITKESTRSIRIIVPPIELQEQFAAFVEQVDKSKLYDEMEVVA